MQNHPEVVNKHVRHGHVFTHRGATGGSQTPASARREAAASDWFVPDRTSDLRWLVWILGNLRVDDDDTVSARTRADGYRSLLTIIEKSPKQQKN